MTVAIPLKTPVSISISGRTGSGKTTWMYRFLKNKYLMLQPPPKEVLYCYGIWQELYSEMEKNVDGINFYEGVPNLDKVKSMPPYSMVVLDDLAHNIYKNKEMELLFSQVSHHNKISVCILKNNIYYQGKHARTIDLNTHVFVLLQNPRDESQILTMGRQIFPNKPLSLLEAYKDSMDLNGYLLLDLQPHSNKKYKMRTRIFPNEDPIIFISN